MKEKDFKALMWLIMFAALCGFAYLGNVQQTSTPVNHKNKSHK